MLSKVMLIEWNKQTVNKLAIKNLQDNIGKLADKGKIEML